MKSNLDIFNDIKEIDANGKSYWNSRKLSNTMGYSEYSKFKRIIDKAINVCIENNQKVEDHFAQTSDMVEVGSGAFRQVDCYHLTQYACLLIATQADGRKEQTLQAIQYFSNKIENEEVIDIQENTDIIFYSNIDGGLRVELTFDGDTLWTTQSRMAKIFSVDIRTISYHLSQIFESGELNRYSVVQKHWITAADGKKYNVQLYNLDAIIAVGYRVGSSTKATQFRIWATQVLSEFIRKGFVMDDERFKKGNKWNEEHFETLLERIREIRASERMLYQKVTDIYAMSDDYRQDAITTKEFYSKVQNKLHWAICGQTAAEIIYTHADATRISMGLTTWKLAPDGKILKSDVTIAKNYLSEAHMKELNQIVSAYLDLAENRAKRRIATTMEEWAKFLDSFLELSSYPILLDKGRITAEQAKIKAYAEYDKYRVIQDKTYLSDFDKELARIRGIEGDAKSH